MCHFTSRLGVAQPEQAGTVSAVLFLFIFAVMTSSLRFLLQPLLQQENRVYVSFMKNVLQCGII